MTCMTSRKSSIVPALLAAGLLLSSLSGCVPLVVGGAAMAGTGLVVTDRRTAGTQLEDESIEQRVVAALRGNFADRVHVNATSYNRQVLLTGEATTAADRERVEQYVARIENVRGVVNALDVMPVSGLTQRSQDTLTTAKVKASFVDAKDIYSNAFKVTTERGVVYLMGRVSKREADRTAEIARGVSGVTKVVRVYELVSESELADIGRQQPPVAGTPALAPAPSAAPATTAAPEGGAVVTPVR